MTVTALDIANHSIELEQCEDETGFTLRPRGEVPAAGVQPTLDLLLIAGALCNDATLSQDKTSGDHYHAVGDPTEGALVLAAACAGILKSDLDRAFPRIAEVGSARKRMTTCPAAIQRECAAGLQPFWKERTRPSPTAFTKRHRPPVHFESCLG
jgi:Ca2+-transporting ATPase